VIVPLKIVLAIVKFKDWGKAHGVEWTHLSQI